MSKFWDKITAPFQSVATHISDDEIITAAETPHYLHDDTLATHQPYYSYARIEDAFATLGFLYPPAEAPLHNSKRVELYGHSDAIRGIEQYIFAGPTIRISTIFKKTKAHSSTPWQLDAITVQEGNVRTCVTCGPEGATKGCVNLFLVCFKEAATTLQATPLMDGHLAEAALKSHLVIAFHTYNLERFLGDIPQNPSFSNR